MTEEGRGPDVGSQAMAVSQSTGAVALAYWEVLKPRVTVLLTFLGAAAAVAAAGADPSQAGRVFLAAVAVFFGGGGANGLTNYLDRAVDARMHRTRLRSIPSGRIFPAERALLWSATWVAVGLFLAYRLHPYAVVAGVAGLIASVTLRKTEATHLLGAVSSAAPVAVGWLALDPRPTPMLAWLLAFVGVWVLHHVWAIMLFYRQDYLQAGVRMFPLRSRPLTARLLFPVLAVLAGILAVSVGIAGGHSGGYYLFVGALAVFNLYGTFQLHRAGLTQATRRRRFKTASYSLLCGLFTALVADAALGMVS